MTVRDWDGAVYDRISAPMEALGRAVLDRLQLTGDETVLDAGCGSGRVTEALLERLPRGRVLAVDASPSMVAAARERLGAMEDRRTAAGREPVEGWGSAAGREPAAGWGSADGREPTEDRAGRPARLEIRQGDLLELEVQEPVDAILSTATFHWIADHERLFARLHAALRPGGRLVAQCGGRGNIDQLRGVAGQVLAREPYTAHFRDWRPPWNYAGPEETEERLRVAGFQSARCWLQPAPQQPEHPREFLSSIVLGPHYQRLPEDLREPFIDTVLDELGRPVVVDYIRLNIDAVA